MFQRIIFDAIPHFPKNFYRLLLNRLVLPTSLPVRKYSNIIALLLINGFFAALSDEDCIQETGDLDDTSNNTASKPQLTDCSVSRSLPMVSSSRRASFSSNYQASPSRSSDLKLVRRRRRNSSILARTPGVVGHKNSSVASNTTSENLEQNHHSSPLTPSRVCQLRQERGRRNSNSTQLSSSNNINNNTTATSYQTESTLSKASVSTGSSCSSLASLEWEQARLVHSLTLKVYSLKVASICSGFCNWYSSSCRIIGGFYKFYLFCSERNSSDTSSFRSDCQDDQEIALALQAAEIATCNKARARFKDSTDLIHRLFVCISGKI